MKPIHLLSALTAFLSVTLFLVGIVGLGQWVERFYVDSLAARNLPLNVKGSALQKQAFHQPDLLPIYGSSELSMHVPGYNPPEFFRNYPTGFAPFVVGHDGVSSLGIAQAIAAVGPDVRGKQVVITFTPAYFIIGGANRNVYDNLFSPLHANELVFSTHLSFSTKRLAARRMLAYPRTLAGEPILRFALQRLAGDSVLDHALYYAIWPLGKLSTMALEVQDQWQTLAFILAQRHLSANVPHQPKTIHWQNLEVQAQRQQESHADNNPYGIDNSVWVGKYQTSILKHAHSLSDAVARRRLQHSSEWTDLYLLLRVLHELGAQPLLISLPYKASYWDIVGASARVRQVYYARLQQVARRYDVPVVDYQEYEYDNYFTVDAWSHPSREAWVYINQTIDQFRHHTLRPSIPRSRGVNLPIKPTIPKRMGAFHSGALYLNGDQTLLGAPPI